MAVFPGPSQPTPGGTGLVTNNDILNQYAAGAQGAIQAAEDEELTVWDSWRQHFVRLPEPGPFQPPQRQRDPNSPFYLLVPDRIYNQQRTEALRTYMREKAKHQKFAEDQEQDRARLKSLAARFFGREATPGEMNKLWLAAVDEAEAAAQLGLIDTGPEVRGKDRFTIGDAIWQSLETMANSEDRPGAPVRPRTSTSTHTTISLTDPQTAQGIIQQALRDALGRRATDEETQAFTNTLNTLERESPTVTTTTSTTTPEGDTTSQSTTEGSSPAPTAVAQSWLDEELNAEIDTFRAGTEYFRVAQALAGGIV